jgi:hypothetical protein
MRLDGTRREDTVLIELDRPEEPGEEGYHRLRIHVTETWEGGDAEVGVRGRWLVEIDRIEDVDTGRPFVVTDEERWTIIDGLEDAANDD